MILVAVIAIGLALHRFSEGISKTAQRRAVIDCKYYLQLENIISDYVITPMITLTFACALLFLRRPRPPLKRLADLPGMAAVTSALGVLILSYFFMMIHLLTGSHPGFVTDPARPSNTTHPGFAVAGAWSMLFLGGRWQPDRSWVDRLGIGVGLAWLSLLLVWLLSPFLTR
jgi:hypothetical protein